MGSRFANFTVDDPDEFLRSPTSRICATLESPSMPLGEDLSPDDFTIMSMRFKRVDGFARVEVEVTPDG